MLIHKLVYGLTQLSKFAVAQGATSMHSIHTVCPAKLPLSGALRQQRPSSQLIGTPMAALTLKL